MTAYYFRVIDQDGKPNGYVGFAMAPTMASLFWMIDEYVNPHSVQIKTAKFAGYCKFVKAKGEGDDYEIKQSKFEFTELEPLNDDDGWRTPKWPEDF